MFTLPDGNLLYWVYEERESGSYLLAAFKALEDAQTYAASTSCSTSIWQAYGNDKPAVRVQ